MNAGRVTEELVEAQETLIASHVVTVTRFQELAADGEVTELERTTFLLQLRVEGTALRDQHRALLAFDVAVKWVVRTVRRGFSAENDRKRLADERNVRAVLVDPFDLMEMAAD